MSEKHTPGPWMVTVDKHGSHLSMDSPTLLIETADNEGPHIAFAFNDAPGNARLLAASPDLLAACKAAAGYELMNVHIKERLDAAIAKAEQ